MLNFHSTADCTEEKRFQCLGRRVGKKMFSLCLGQCHKIFVRKMELTYRVKLSGFIDIRLEVPLSGNVQSALIRMLLLDIVQQLASLFRFYSTFMLKFDVVGILVVVKLVELKVWIVIFVVGGKLLKIFE